jgi:hypothetical protein
MGRRNSNDWNVEGRKEHIDHLSSNLSINFHEILLIKVNALTSNCSVEFFQWVLQVIIILTWCCFQSSWAVLALNVMLNLNAMVNVISKLIFAPVGF